MDLNRIVAWWTLIIIARYCTTRIAKIQCNFEKFPKSIYPYIYTREVIARTIIHISLKVEVRIIWICTAWYDMTWNCVWIDNKVELFTKSINCYETIRNTSLPVVNCRIHLKRRTTESYNFGIGTAIDKATLIRIATFLSEVCTQGNYSKKWSTS